MLKKSKLKIEKINWYGLNHEFVTKKLEGGLSFLNTFCVNNEYNPSAVYKVARPNKAKGHKKYVLLNIVDAKHVYIRGMDKKEMEKWRYQDAVHCLECDKVIFSANRHDYHFCGCSNETMVDGGKDYCRYGGRDLSKIKIVRLDFLTDKIIECKKP